jgi:isopentenyl-diphosphate delta-isomerase
MQEELVLLVDADDNPIGETPKLQAHQEGRLHRAVSAFVFDPSGRMLLQRRAAGKYHSAGLWSNACCTHPRPGETTLAAANRRLEEEMGLSCDLRFRFTFLYRAELDSGLVEHELDHVFTGVTSGEPRPDPAEVSDWRWVAVGELVEEVAAQPDRFTAWFPLALERVLAVPSMEEEPVSDPNPPRG